MRYIAKDLSKHSPLATFAGTLAAADPSIAGAMVTRMVETFMFILDAEDSELLDVEG